MGWVGMKKKGEKSVKRRNNEMLKCGGDGWGGGLPVQTEPLANPSVWYSISFKLCSVLFALLFLGLLFCFLLPFTQSQGIFCGLSYLTTGMSAFQTISALETRA